MDNEAAGFEEFGRRLRSIEESLANRLLPPGYVFNIVDGDLVITRTADGATTTWVLA